MSNVGTRIRNLREEKGVLQRELADILGTKQHNISLYESGDRRPNYETLIALAKFFNVTVGQLLGTEEL